MSAVRSVSGLAIEVLKFDPFRTVNHCPFLCGLATYVRKKSQNGCAYFWVINFRFLRSAKAFSPAWSVPVESTSRSSNCVLSSIEVTFQRDCERE